MDQPALADATTRSALTTQEQLLQEFKTGADHNGFQVLYTWRNSTLHGGEHARASAAGAALNTAIIVALDRLTPAEYQTRRSYIVDGFDAPAQDRIYPRSS